MSHLFPITCGDGSSDDFVVSGWFGNQSRGPRARLGARCRQLGQKGKKRGPIARPRDFLSFAGGGKVGAGVWGSTRGRRSRTLPHVKQRTGMIMLTTEADAPRATSVLRSRL